MDTLPSNVPSPGPAYVKAGAFLFPGLLMWWFSTVFLFPKLQQIWADTGFAEPVFQQLLSGSNALMSHGLWIAAIGILLLGLLEWRSRGWPRYRGMSLGILAWILNTAVFLLLTAMLLSALMAAPALLRE